MSGVEKKLGWVTATAVVLGNIVGVMIFLTPATVARHLPWDGWFLTAWALGGLLALLGALSLGELGAMMPEAGGDYVYMRRAFGPQMAFLSGWVSVAIAFPGSLAAMAVGLCSFQGAALLGDWVREPLLTLDLAGVSYSLQGAQLLSLAVIALLTAINHLGLRFSGWLQTAVTAFPVLLLLGAGVGTLFVTPAGPLPPAIDASGLSPLAGLWPAIVPIFFAYAGWNATTYIGGEIRQPGRNLPLSLIAGTLLALILYLVVSAVFLQGLPAAHMPAAKPNVPAVALARLFGPSSGQLLTLIIALAVLGSLNATVLAGARIGYAMAHRDLPFVFLRRESRFKTPAAALWLQAAIAALLALSGGFEALINYVTAMMLLFSSLTILAVFVLRWREPAAPRPYRVWGYPLTPAAYILFSLAVVVGLCWRSPAEVLWGLFATLLALPLWFLLRRSASSSPSL